MIQSIFILNSVGDIIIEKHFRGLLNRNVCDYFWDEVGKSKSVEDVPPIITTPKYYLIHIQKNSLFFLSVVAMEVAPLLVVEFLYRVVEIFGQYFEPKFNEAILRENFVTVYQLLDEMMDNGVPFTTEPNSLMEMIPPRGRIGQWVGEVSRNLGLPQQNISGQVPDGSLSNTFWRKAGVKYATNEIYFDIFEDIDCTIDTNGLAVSCEVVAEVQVLAKLSGMPDLSLQFNNPQIMDDISFHPCVRYNRYEQSKVISFVPPDGQFKLMTYRVKGQLQLPIYVKPQISLTPTAGAGGNSGKVSVMVGTKNIQGHSVEDVVITIPFPKIVSSPTLSANFGFVQFDDITKVCRWSIGKLPKDKSPLLEGTVSLANIGAGESVTNPILQAEFKLSMYSASGIKVESLSIHNEKYKPYKGVRFITRGGKFHIRS